MSSLEDAMTALTAAIKDLASDLRAGVIDPGVGEDLAARMRVQLDVLGEAIASAKSARGELE